MSEEKPNFKVTDRRLFNADGSPREIEREEPAPAPAAAAAAPEAARSDAEPATSAPTSAARDEAKPPPEPTPPAGRIEGDAAAGGSHEADDPQEFLLVVEFIASFAAEALGMATHPDAAGAPPPQINLPLARQCIDMLGALERKTRGNLSPDELQFLDMVLSQLRMQFVQLTQARGGGPAGRGPRGFSGSDITGGR